MIYLMMLIFVITCLCLKNKTGKIISAIGVSWIFVYLPVCAQQNSKSHLTMFNREIASKLAALPLSCINKEWPNKTSHTSDSSSDHLLLPHQLHPSFYGCLDWHSSVHGHWMLLKLIKLFPDIPEKAQIIAVLDNSFQPDKLLLEADYFARYKTSKTYERTYGWAWLLKLDEELYTWEDPLARKWHNNLQPLTAKVVDLWTEYLPKQTYPNRTGVHPNTAFGLVFALDWARTVKNTLFEKKVIQRSLDYFGNNKAVPAHFEPDATDFLSPSLEVADLMKRVLPESAFTGWIKTYFTPEGIKNITSLPIVSDRTDFQIVHLDGLSLSRAWCMKGIARALPEKHAYRKLFEETAGRFLTETLPHVTSGNYGGDHWLASFAVYALFE
ncbi:MAG: DUF2891 domain-containing protein [Chitinophagaceae bacterium]